MVQEEPQFLNVQKAASFLGVHPHTVRRWANENKLQGKRIGTRGDWRFSREALQNMLRNAHAAGEAPEGLIHSSSRKRMQHTHHASLTAFLAGGGEMGERMRAMDWSKTPLGPVERWPQSLSTLVATSLRSRFPIVIWWDRQHYTMLYNDAYIPCLGKTKHPRWLGQSGRECWKEIWPTIGPMFEGVFATGQPTWSEDLLLVMDRNLPLEETYFTFSYSAIPGETGVVDGIFCACTETTERVLSERRLQTLRDLASRAAEARSAEEACEVAAHLLAQNHADIPFALIYLLNRDRTIAHLVALSSLSPGSAAAVQSIQLSQLLHEDTWPLDEVARQAKPRLVRPLAGNFGTLPGGPWPESPNSALVLPLMAPGQNQVTGFLVVGVNPRRMLDEPYRDFFTLVAGHVETAVANARAYEEERKRAEALAEIDRAKTTFFSNVSHEFRTPLTLMLGPIEEALSEKSQLSQEQRERTEILHRNSLRLLKLVNTLLDFSRIEAGRIQAVYEPTDLAALTADLASSFRSAIEKAGMQLIVDCPPLPQHVYVDHEMWEKIVLNLLSNAFKYTFKGNITVSLRQTKDGVEFSVQDTGVGIPQEELPHMLERFHRVKGTEGRTYEGTGIGLSLVQELVKLHGGTIRVQSGLGKGSTFTVSLPRGTTHLPHERIAAQRTLASTAIHAQVYVNEALGLLPEQEAGATFLPEARQGLQQKAPPDNGKQTRAARILFADDNADMRVYVSRLLQQRYEVQAVADGKAALAAVKQSQPDLVLADVMMPKMDGFELLQALRSDPQTSTLPVILLSARAGEEARIEGMEAGADDYLIKPFSARELLARVGAHLEADRTRKEVERAVKTERERLYGLFWQAPAAIAVVEGEHHVYTLANPLYQKLCNRTQKELLGRTVREVFPEFAEQGVYEAFDTVYTSGESFVANEFPATFARSVNGAPEQRYFNVVAHPIQDDNHHVERILVHAVEVTDLVKAREHIKASEERFHTLADNIPNLAWMAHPDGWVYWYNSRWYDYTGTTPEQAEGWGWQAVHDPQALPAVLEQWKGALQSGEPATMVCPLRGADGLFRPFLTRAVPIYDTRGAIVQWFGTGTDISEQKRLEQQKEEFIGVASHELKTPLTSIKAYAQLLERGFRRGGDERTTELLKKMDAQIDKLNGLIGDLLDVTRIESGKLLFHPSSFDYHKLVQEIVEETQQTTTRHTIVMQLSSSVMLYADRNRIGQVLTNLLTNAIKYAPHAETIIVKTVHTDETLITSVLDFGIGIPKEKCQHIFERFGRVEGERQITYPGLGLGLYISAEFVKRHHGSIWVESEEGKGSTFSFSLPLQPAQAEVNP